jgi:hypothetical protein
VKVDSLWARLFGCFLRFHLDRFGGSDPARERWEPPRNRLRIVVNHIVDAKLRIKRSDRRSSCILDMDERPNAFAITDDRRFLALRLLGDSTIGPILSARPVKEAVAQGDPTNLRATQHALFQLRVHS